MSVGQERGSLLERVICWLQDWMLPLRLHLGRKIMYDEQRSIVQVSATELIKGPCSAQELEAMEHAAAHTTVCVPRIHRTYRCREGLFVAMDFVPGTRLDVLWPQLDDEQRRAVVGQVWDSVRQLHACGPPAALGPVVAAAVTGGPLVDGALGIDASGAGAAAAGPFASLADLAGFLHGNADAEAFPPVPARTGLVHADLTPRNLIRTPDGRLCLIDWEFAGWWPLYWERVKWHFSDFPPVPGWASLMDDASGWLHGGQGDEEPV